MSLKFQAYIYCFISLVISSPSFAKFQTLVNFGDNPGELTASYYQPESSISSVVVLLHGCVQNGEELAMQSGFAELAKEHNFALLIPQQKQSNNVKSCFNWFSEQDSLKNQGEVLSIKNMVMTLKTKTKVNDVYIAGLSAGGAMTSALLVHYPELFSAGAVVAGLPYPCANNLAKAISCMRNGPSQSTSELVALVKPLKKTIHQWPRLLVITGNEDVVVNPKNATSLALQWAKLTSNNSKEIFHSFSDFQVRSWLNNKEETLVKLITIDEIGHGISVNTRLGNRNSESAFLLESSVDSAKEIVDFWFLLGKVDKNQ
ncbi:MAG: PHB depolymerase family esterase [Colwellia sp.]|nr:PHB depolymerase family esterase [Colwellia sp.]